MRRSLYTSVYILLLLLMAGKSAAQQDSVALKDSLLRKALAVSRYELERVLQTNAQLYHVQQEQGSVAYYLGNPRNVVFTPHAIVFMFDNGKTADINLDALRETKIRIITGAGNLQSGLSATLYMLKCGNTVIVVYNNNLLLLQIIRDWMRKIQDLSNDLFFQVNAFDKAASLYRTGTEKPPITEAQRVCIIQAQSQATLYNFEKAIDLNEQVIKIHPTSYPAVYFNLAILQGETNRWIAAIYNMKKFLLLQPEAADSVAASKKIDEWQTILDN